MKVNQIAVGAVYLLENLFTYDCPTKESPKYHYYIIIGNGSNNGELGMVQLMGITSMKNKEINREIPVVLNDSISYIIPYNIYSMSKTELLFKGKYKGSIGNDPDFSIEDFVETLMSLYLDSLGSVVEMHDVAQNWYNLYMENFHKMYGEYKTYAQKINEKLKSRKSLWSRNMTYYPPETSTKQVDEDSNDTKLYEDTTTDIETVYSEDEKFGSRIIIPNEFVDSGKHVVNTDKKTKEPTSRDISAIRSLEDAPRRSSEWTDEELTIFSLAYNMYGVTIASYCNRWSKTSLAAMNTKVRKEMKTRGLKL